jgi:hypothetical protein
MADLARKLGAQSGTSICLLDPTPETEAILRAACGGDLALDTALTADRYDLIFLWPRALDGFAARLAELSRHIVPEGAIWDVMPKKAIALKRGLGLTWDEMQAAALTTDLVDNKIASISDEEYGTRFVIRKERRASR